MFKKKKELKSLRLCSSFVLAHLQGCKYQIDESLLSALETSTAGSTAIQLPRLNMTSCSIRSLNDNDAKQLHKMCHRFSAHELVETRDPHGPTFRITYDKEEMFALEYLVCRRALMLDQLLIDVPTDHPLIRAEHFSLVPPQTKAAQLRQTDLRIMQDDQALDQQLEHHNPCPAI